MMSCPSSGEGTGRQRHCQKPSQCCPLRRGSRPATRALVAWTEPCRCQAQPRLGAGRAWGLLTSSYSCYFWKDCLLAASQQPTGPGSGSGWLSQIWPLSQSQQAGSCASSPPLCCLLPEHRSPTCSSHFLPGVHRPSSAWGREFQAIPRPPAPGPSPFLGVCLQESDFQLRFL